MQPVVVGVLHDAKRVDPDVPKSEASSYVESFFECERYIFQWMTSLRDSSRLEVNCENFEEPQQ